MTVIRRTAIATGKRMFTIEDNHHEVFLFNASKQEFLQMRNEIDGIIRHMEQYPEMYE
jgi:hypothetical protein